MQAGGPQEPVVTKVNSIRTVKSNGNNESMKKKKEEIKEEVKPNGSGYDAKKFTFNAKLIATFSLMTVIMILGKGIIEVIHSRKRSGMSIRITMAPSLIVANLAFLYELYTTMMELKTTN